MSNNGSEAKEKQAGTILELLIICNRAEFLGQNKASDQLIWRKREDQAFALKFRANGNHNWETIQLFQVGTSWDGDIYLVLESNGLNHNSTHVEVEGFIKEHTEDNNDRKEKRKFLNSVISTARKIRQSKRKEELKKSVKTSWAAFKTLIEKEAKYRRFEITLSKDYESIINSIEKIEEICTTLRGDHDAVPSPMSNVIRKGRAAVCSSFEGKATSIVIRRDDTYGETSTIDIPKELTFWDNTSDWKASEDRNFAPFSIEDYVSVLRNIIFPESDTKYSGLIVIMAETSAGKSQIAYGLMHRYLSGRIGKDEFLHALTLEDPIEKRAYRDPNYPVPPEPNGVVVGGDDDRRDAIHYTARHKMRDTTLKTGLQDALRQKPAIVCVGEIRQSDDWDAVMEFAATGHLVVATAHADKLSSSMGKILRARGATTPAQRGDEAHRILALIHLQHVEVPVQPQDALATATQSAILMTLWRRGNGGADSLVSSGRDSIAPHWDEGKGVIGAQKMCKLLINHRDGDETIPKPDVALPRVFRTTLMNEALKHDCEGI